MCFKHSDENIRVVDLLYPAATVLLDLTANDQLIDQLSVDLKKWDIFNFIINKMLPKLTCVQYPDCQTKKMRDLFIGIVLNLTCNIEDTEMIKYLVKEMNIIEPLVALLSDSR